MGKSSPSPPPVPDPAATAQAQGAANRDAAIAGLELSMMDQRTPQGSLTYREIGESDNGNPRYRVTTKLSPRQEDLLRLQNRVSRKFATTADRQAGRLRNTLSAPLRFNDLGEVPTADFSGLGAMPAADEATRLSVADSLMQRMMPQLDDQRDRIETRLANQGITDVNSDAYRGAVDEFNRSRNDAILATNMAAGDEMARLFNMGMAGRQQAASEIGQQFQMDSAARDRAINERILQRSQPLNELAAMMTGAQVQNPQFVGTPQTSVAPAPVADATYGSYQGQMNAYNAARQSQNAMMGGLFGLAGNLGSAAILSDRRAKTSIQRVGSLRNGLPVYTYRYRTGGPTKIGVMADEVRQIMPDAVVRCGKYGAVDYRKVLRGAA